MKINRQQRVIKQLCDKWCIFWRQYERSYIVCTNYNKHHTDLSVRAGEHDLRINTLLTALEYFLFVVRSDSQVPLTLIRGLSLECASIWVTSLVYSDIGVMPLE